MADDSNWNAESNTRRDFIKYAAAGSTVLIAGCDGAGNNTPTTGGDSGSNQTSSDTEESTTSSDVDRADARFRIFDPTTSGTNHPERHLNPFNPSQSGCWHPGANVFDQPVLYSMTNDELYPHIVTDWEVSDNTMDVTFSEEWSWHNGDQVVAQDWGTQLQIALELQRFTADEGAKPNPVVESVEAVDDQLLRFNLYDSFPANYVFRTWLDGSLGDNSRGIYVKHDMDIWTESLQNLRDAEGDELENVVGDVTSANTPELSSDAIGNGPFQITQVGDLETVMEVYDDHPNADNINFNEYVLKLFTNAEEPVQAYQANQVDAAHRGFPVTEDVRAQLPEEHTLINEARSSNKLFAFNCGHDVSADTPFESRNVRKAVGHVFDLQQVSQLLQGVNRLFEWPACRIPGEIMKEESYPAVEWTQDFTQYGQNNTERATELLQREGYERDSDGNWFNPDGDRFEVSFMNAGKRPDFQVLSQNLQDFGVSVSQETVDQATFDERRQNGEYHMMPDASGADGVKTMWGSGLLVEWLPSILHYSVESEIPMPIGDPDGENGTKEINVSDHILQWQTTDEDQYHKELMWWWNQNIPELEVMYEPNAGAYNGANWNLEADDQGIRDLLYAVPKMENASLQYTGN